jgi:HlyD family type I secretion membrane fusion protein
VHPIVPSKVARLMVQEGQAVQAGQVIAQLDTELEQQDVARLEQRLKDGETELRQMQEVLERARVQADARSTIAQAAIRVQNVALNQARSQVTTTEAMLQDLRSDADAQTERLNRIKPLQEDGAVAVEQVFQVEQALRDRARTILDSQGNLQKSVSDAERIEEEMVQARADAERINQESEQHIQQVKLQITELQTKINETKGLLESARSKLNQGFLHAPVSGTVSTLNVRNVGEVVQPGQAIAEIAPAGKPLVLSALVPSQKAGFIKPGMAVQVKLDAYPYQNYGIVPGEVTAISPDSKPDERLGQVYRVEIKLARSHIVKDHQEVRFQAGQTASAEIVTRDRRIVEVLIDPIRQLQGDLNL